ncbi:beta-1,3-galactosyltransferase 1-like isoform X2 [Bradysia coprophila]|uniref:beta-1,3-galactosyltransferase 1-like isoform X2 n=1 Tax=Bradysia coprophila TaxID=38358 RepID=UPI00187D8F26|nr:beta-1,3-galactosyltransferase 1-like isoform X2 [Bradysia coprophila]
MGLIVALSSLKNSHFLPNQLVKWKVVLLLSLTTLLIIYVRVLYLSPMVPVYPIDLSKLNQTINHSHHRPKTKVTFMNKDLCVSPPIQNKNLKTAVIVVLSARANFNQRNLVRQTYGSVKYANNVQILALIFMLSQSGVQANNETENKKLEAEREQFADTMMGDFVDSYRNLTLKTIMAYEWLTEHCRQAQFVVKTDDDVIVDIFKLTHQLDSFSPADMASSNIWCWIHFKEDTIKDENSIYYAPAADFPSGKFPEHCGGVGYIAPFGVIERIMNDISNSFPGRVSTHEDVFITGVVPAHINSMASYLWPNSEPITRVSQPESVSYVFQNGRDDKDDFMKNFVKNATMDTEVKNLDTFRERFGKRIFFLISHNKEFEMIYRRLWEIIKKTVST